MSKKVIDADTAREIAFAYREIETAEELLTQITETLSRGDKPDIRDAFGRRQDGLQLGVPSGASGHRLFDVPWELCRPIIEAHMNRKRSLIQTLSTKAFMGASDE